MEPKPNGKIDPVFELRLKFQEMRERLEITTGLLIGLLREKHGGRAFVKIDMAQESQFLGFQFENMGALGTIRITAVDRSGRPLLTEPTAEISPNASGPIESITPSISCGGPWHSDPNATGLLCPNCGSRERAA